MGGATTKPAIPACKDQKNKKDCNNIEWCKWIDWHIPEGRNRCDYNWNLRQDDSMMSNKLPMLDSLHQVLRAVDDNRWDQD